MKKLICLLSTAVMLTASFTRAATLNEWNFYSDPAGKTLSAAVNSAGNAVFSSGGTGYLETDGQGSLLCTHNDAGTAGMWTNGAVLDAATASLTSGVYFLRYDFEYDLSSTNNDSGTLLGFSFTDASGSKVAGVALKYDVGAATAPTNLTVTELTDLGTNYNGNISVITKVDLSAQKLSVWYDLSGTGTFTAENSPQASNLTVNLPSIDKLRFQATGDFTPAGSDDSADISLLRMTDSFASAIAAPPAAPDAKYSNEWTFERDINGRSLSEAINSGTNSPLAQFSAGFSTTVFTTNRALLCIGNDSGTNGVWTNGAVLNAALPSATSGIHYLRYDVAYDFSSTNNNSGTLLGVYFTDTSGDKAAGLVLGYEAGNLASAAPSNRTLVSVTNNLPLSGTLTAIAEVNLDTDTLRVWYDMTGSNTFDTNTPAATTNINLSSIDNLRFHATGDFRPTGSSNYAAIDNIRHTASWSEISDPPENLTAPPQLTVTSVADSSNGAMEIGETNTVTVVISNSGGPATAVSSTLICNGTPSAFTVVSNNAPNALNANSVLTNTYSLIALSNGQYSLSIQAVSAETNSAATNLAIVVGSRISYFTNTITEVSGGVVSGKYEPGETVQITVVSTNDGARDVNNITNSLSAPAYFSISPASAVYPVMLVGRSASTVYTVAISNTTPAGIYTFNVVNRANGSLWTNSFQLEVFSGSIPSVTNSLIIDVISGAATNKTLVLGNSGNASAQFSISDSGVPTDAYTVSAETASLIPFPPIYDAPDPSSTFTNWDGNNTASVNIGFDFPFYGTVYTNFSVNKYGILILGSVTATEPAIVVPFWSDTAVSNNSVRYSKYSDKLIVSWGNRTGKEFQTWLYRNGDIRYVYQQTASSWGAGWIGVMTDANREQGVSFSPGVADASLLLTPASWITYTPAYGTVTGSGSTPVTFTVNAINQSIKTNSFNMYVAWSDNTTSTVAVTVRVLAATRGLSISPSNAIFSGSAGFITQTNVSLINTGNIDLAYTITDQNMQGNGYSFTNVAYQWQNIPHDIDPIALIGGTDEGYSQLIQIGFPFPFYGNVYTQLSIGVNGAISLGEARLIEVQQLAYQTSTTSGAITNRIIYTNTLETANRSLPNRGFTYASTFSNPVPNHFIAPYWGNLLVDNDANIRCFGDANKLVISWENMRQLETGGGSNLTFQAILNRDGSIYFQYKKLTGSDIWPQTQMGLRDTISRIIHTSLSNQLTTVITTNYTTTTSNLYDMVIVVTNATNIVVSYTNTVTNQAIRFTPAGGRTVITASPLSGTIPVGGTATVKLTGDARSLTSNGVNSVTNQTTFGITYADRTNSLAATFIATNSVQTAYSEALASGIAGTDYFAASVVQNPDGSRLISWPAVTDGTDALSRRYVVYFTTNLLSSWTPIYEGWNVYSWLDTDTVRSAQPVIYYKVTVE